MNSDDDDDDNGGGNVLSDSCIIPDNGVNDSIFWLSWISLTSCSSLTPISTSTAYVYDDDDDDDNANDDDGYEISTSFMHRNLLLENGKRFNAIVNDNNNNNKHNNLITILSNNMNIAQPL